MRRKGKGLAVALPAVLGALALVLLWLASAAPTGNWGLVALAGVLPAAAVVSVGLRAGLLCWAGVSLLAFLLIPDKFIVLLFAALFGPYPVVKSLIEGTGRKALGYVLKLVFFNAAFTLIYFTARTALLGSLPAALGEVWVLYSLGNVVFLAYDYGFSRLIALYIARIQRAIH